VAAAEEGSRRSQVSRRVTFEPGLCQDQSDRSTTAGGRGFGKDRFGDSPCPRRAVGVGTQALGLATLGFQVTGSDIS